MRYKVRVARDFSRIDGYCLWLFKYDEQSRSSYKAKPIKIEWEAHDSYLLADPTLQFENTEGPDVLRAIAEGIIESGIAPMLSVDSAKQVEAMEANLKDLREIVAPLISKVTERTTG